MHVVVFADCETFPKLEEVDRPIPGPGEVRLKVAGVGACHSDVSVYNAPKGSPSALTPLGQRCSPGNVSNRYHDRTD